jgi:Domain of unknown function (DUF4157)
MAMRTFGAKTSHNNKKSTKDSGATTVQASLKSRPFAPLAKPDSSRTMADVQAQLEHAQRYGHSLAKMSLSPRQPTPPMIQPKLTIGAPGDKYEQEADRMAQQVVQQLNAPQSTKSEQSIQRETLPEEEDELQMKPLADRIQRMEMPEEEEELQMKPDVLQRETLLEEEDELQMKSMVQRSFNGAMPASENLESAIAQARGSGQPLAVTIRQPMEQAFGADFSGVKVHTDSHSDRLNRSIQARAFTTGQDIFFSRGAYQPTSQGGQKLIAHELTHVVQQGQRGKSKVLEESAESDIQRKMRTDQLNVAGETHSESNPRRDEERRFSKDRSGSPNYWKENEFEVTQKNQTKEAADSPYLRAVHIIALMGNAGKQAHEKATSKRRENRKNLTINPTLPQKTDEEYVTELRNIYITVDPEIQNVKTYIDRLQKSHKAIGVLKIDNLYADMTERWLQLYNDHQDAMKPNSKWAEMQKSLKAISTNGGEMSSKLDELEKLTNIREPMQARLKRSEAMMLGAQQEKGQRGTWKVGDLHIVDMRNIPQSSAHKEVNILSKDEFNQELKEWQLWKKREELVRQLMEKYKNDNAWKAKYEETVLKLLKHYSNYMHQKGEETNWPPLKWDNWEKAVGIVLMAK